MNRPDAPPPQRPVPTAPPFRAPAPFARAMRDTRLTWRARGVLAEPATGRTPGPAPAVSEPASPTRGERLAAGGRGAFRGAVGELRSLGHLSPDATTASGVDERPVVGPAPAAAAHPIRRRHGHSPFTDGS
ncbi:hypothetical protein LUX05_22565 [Streptomyces somaliensis]|nr:hypothetical protein [Streptomyces somaliensis]